MAVLILLIKVFVIRPVLDISITGDFHLCRWKLFLCRCKDRNLGTREITKVNMEARLEDGTTIKEKYEQLIPNGPPEFKAICLKQRFWFQKIPTFDYYCIKASDPNDETDNIPSNNEKCFNRTSNLAFVNLTRIHLSMIWQFVLSFPLKKW